MLPRRLGGGFPETHLTRPELGEALGDPSTSPSSTVKRFLARRLRRGMLVLQGKAERRGAESASATQLSPCWARDAASLESCTHLEELGFYAELAVGTGPPSCRDAGL